MDKIKVGITFIGYECSELMPRALAPWIQIRKNSSLVDCFESLKISLSHGCFEETAKLGFPILSSDKSHEWMALQKELGNVDNFILYKDPMKEYDMWSGNYHWMKDDIDFLVMLNHDEMWTPEEIQSLFRYVSFNPFVNYYKVNFKNYCIDENTWVDDFIVPRMWWVNRNVKLKGFYKDELVEYENGVKDFQTAFANVPKNLLFPKHLTWVGSKSYLQRKLHFQALRFGACSYRWDDATDKLTLNDDFYAKFGVPKPILHHDI
jgi:hypothetical protein